MSVPLFIMLTGYLSSGKTANKKYYSGLLNIAAIYLFYCILVILFRIFYLGEEIEMYVGLSQIFSYQSQDRVWYMNAYFGLAILIPFINVGWKQLDANQKKWALVILFFLTSVSKFVQTYSTQLGYPIILISSYWYNLYIVLYYLLGAWIKENKIGFKRTNILITYVLLILVHTGIYYLLGNGKTFQEIIFAPNFWYENPVLVVECILFFLLVYDIEIKNVLLKKIIREVSISSFDIYLCSYITDWICYKFYRGYYYKIPYFIVMFSMLFSSLIFAFIIARIRRKITGVLGIGNR